MAQIGNCIILLAIVFLGMYVIGKWQEEVDKSHQVEFDGKKYRYMCVGMDVNRGFQDTIQTTLGNISKSELKRRNNNGTYAINAYVQVGKPEYTWKEEPINKETFFLYASDYEYLPKYLQTPTMKLVKQYREEMNKKATG